MENVMNVITGEDSDENVHYPTAERRKVIDALIKCGVDITVSDTDKEKALIIAAYRGDHETVKILLDHGADVNIYSIDHDWTPLMLCAQNDKTDCMKILLQHKADIEAKNKNGNTALTICTFKGHKCAVQLLLQYGANPNAQNNDGWSPLMLSAFTGHTEIVQYLLQAPTINLELRNYSQPETALLMSARTGHVDVLKALLEKGANVNAADSNGCTALNISAYIGHKEIVDMLIKKRAALDQQNNDGDTPLLSCAKKKKFAILETLVKAGADVTHQNKNGETVLLICSFLGWSQYVKIILEAGRTNCDQEYLDKANRKASNSCDNHTEMCGAWIEAKTENGDTALSIFAAKGDKNSVGMLLEYGANPNSQNNKGFSPLMLSAFNGHIEMVYYLLQAPTINLELKECATQDTALLMAAKRGHRDIVKALLDQGADLSAANSHGSTALNISAKFGYEEIVRLLTINRAVLDKCDNDGNTPLLSCVKAKQHVILKILVEAGADVTHQNKKGETAPMICSRYGWSQYVKLILKRDSINCIQEYINKAAGIANSSGEYHMDNCDAGIETKDENGNTALSTFAAEGDKNVVKLLNYGANPNTQNNEGFTPLMLSAKYGHTETVEYLLQAPTINLELRDYVEHETALLISTRCGHRGIVNALLDKGADVNATDYHGSTALNISAQYGYEEIVNDLIKKGAALNKYDNDGDTPLLTCAMEKQRDILEILIKAGADVTHQNKMGQTALMFCSRFGYGQSVKLILEKGWGKITQYELDNAAEYAHSCGHKEIHQLIKDYRYNADVKKVINSTVPAPRKEFRNIDLTRHVSSVSHGETKKQSHDRFSSGQKKPDYPHENPSVDSEPLTDDCISPGTKEEHSAPDDTNGKTKQKMNASATKDTKLSFEDMAVDGRNIYHFHNVTNVSVHGPQQIYGINNSNNSGDDSS